MFRTAAPFVGSLVVLFSTVALAAELTTIRTRDGRVLQGRVISETQRGFLFSTDSGTQLVPFEAIADMSAASAPKPVEPVAETPPPPPARPVEPPVAAFIETEPSGPKPLRSGIHFGVGAFTGASAHGLLAGGEAALDFNFGRVSYRLTSGGGISGSNGLVFADNLFHVNITNLISVGLGVEVGVLFSDLPYAYVAPMVQPVVIKFGDAGHHQLALTGSFPVAGGPNVLAAAKAGLSYAYYF